MIPLKITGQNREVAPRTGGRGLKCQQQVLVLRARRRPPHRGAWIEIPCYKRERARGHGRPPHRGAWIEIVLQKIHNQAGASRPPHRGAWIEM